jgi:hypothetical protein
VNTPPFTPTARLTATVVRAVVPKPAVPRPSANDVFELARAAEKRRAPMAVAGHRLYWASRWETGSIDLPAGPTSFLVAGRHTACDIYLANDTSVSLRHVLLRSTSVDGSPVLSALDLQSSRGIELANGSVHRSIAARGMMSFALGAYVFIALPSDERVGATLPEAICTPALAHPYRALAPRPLGTSQITLLPQAMELLTLAPLRLDRTRESVRIYEVVMRSDRMVQATHVSSTWLEHGILIGRAKCFHPAFLKLFSDAISRVHLVIQRTPRGNVAYDAASLHGTYEPSGQRRRALPLDDEGTWFAIAHAHARISVSWRAV